MKIVQLTTDDREAFRHYEEEIPRFGTAPEALLQGFSLLPGIEVHVVSCTKRRMTSPAKLASNIYFHSLVVPSSGWLKTGYQGCVRATRRKLREIAPDLVHGQGTERDCSLSAALSGFPNVVTIHGNMRLVARVKRARPFSYPWLAARLEGFTIPRTEGVVCITNYTRETVASLAQKTWVVPNAVDATFFDIMPRRTNAPPRLLCVATVEPRKNQNFFIRALDTLQPQGKFEVVFFGRTNDDTAFTQEFRDLLSTRPWCRYGGVTSRAGLKEELAEASALILPSLEDNCPMVVLEAMAAGVPVAAARVGGVPDLIRPGENGLLFDPHNGQAIAAATAQLLGDGAPAMALLAKTEARVRFHPEIVARRHLEVYDEILSAHPH